MNIVVLSRARTPQIVPAKYDTNINTHGNSIEGDFPSLVHAINYIKNGNKTKVYYICLPIDDAIALNQYNDASNGYYVHSRYCNVNGKWTRMCISTNKSWDYSKKNGYTNRY